VKRLENVKLERNETPDQRAKRLARDRESKIKSRATETAEKCKERLRGQSQYIRTNRWPLICSSISSSRSLFRLFSFERLQRIKNSKRLQDRKDEEK